MDPYQILNVSSDASLSEIKKAYFLQVRKHPPEKDPEMFKQIRAAYEQLKSVVSRAKTDLFTLKEPEGDFILPSDKETYKIEISFADFLVAVEALYSDLMRTDFSTDLNSYHEN